MTSKEALERLEDNGDDYLLPVRVLKLIKQDLDRLEQLEKAYKNNEGIVRDNVKLMNKNLELQKENQELQQINEEFLQSQIKVVEKIEKLEKAISILKDKFEIIAVKEDYDGEYIIETSTYFLYINQKQCELLKEVLQDE